MTDPSPCIHVVSKDALRELSTLIVRSDSTRLNYSNGWLSDGATWDPRDRDSERGDKDEIRKSSLLRGSIEGGTQWEGGIRHDILIPFHTSCSIGDPIYEDKKRDMGGDSQEFGSFAANQLIVDNHLRGGDRSANLNACNQGKYSRLGI